MIPSRLPPSLVLHVLTFVEDEDAVRILQLDSTSRSALDGYRVKRPVKYSTYTRLSSRRHPLLVFSRLVHVPSPLSALPVSLTHLSLSPNFNAALPPLCLAGLLSLTHLTFYWKYNVPLAVGSLPSTLSHLTLSRMFNQAVLPHHLPDNITHLTFGELFNQPLSVGVLPTRIVQLTFLGEFNRRLEAGVLPTSLTRLTFGRWFNQPLAKGVLPCALVELVFGQFYNHTLEPDVLPASLCRLTFGSAFGKPLAAGVLPCSLRSLRFQRGRTSAEFLKTCCIPRGCEITIVDVSGETRTCADVSVSCAVSLHRPYNI